MEHPQRKHPRLKEYDYNQPGAYFVTICTHERKCVLSNISVGRGLAPAACTQLTQCGTIAEEQLLDLERRYPHVRIDKYVIMPNHIHMILRILQANIDDFCRGGVSPPVRTAVQENGTENPIRDRDGKPVPYCLSPTLGNVIGWYKYHVTKQINLLRNSPGEKIFQRSYHDHVIRNETDWREIWEYIENNPAKWAEDKYYM